LKRINSGGTMAAPTKDQLAAREGEVKVLVEQDKRDEAGDKLFELIVDCARGGDINNANRLRDMLYDVDPMALTSIIKANEIIDEAMSGAISEDFVQAWSGLHDALTGDEFMALYHSLEKHEVGGGKTVVKAGSRLDALFFVNKGNLSVICDCMGKDVEVKTLEPGTMIGENFFQPSIWTVSVVTITPVELFILRQKQLLALVEKFPGI
jgi:CRP-like cAMP-binding protein